MMDGAGGIAPTWTWAVPLAASLIALAGVAVSVSIQYATAQKQLRASNAVNIAEMRRQWIENLRDALSKMAAIHLAGSLDGSHAKEGAEHITRILLMLNPNDRYYSQLNGLMRNLRVGDFDKTDDVWGEYVYVSQKILKSEWDRLKRDITNAGQRPEHDPPLWFRNTKA